MLVTKTVFTDLDPDGLRVVYLTIRLRARDFYAVIVDSGFALIEIESE